MITSEPRFGGAIFCDSIRQSASGKVDCYGVFTALLIWAYPTAIRSWNALVTAYGLPPGCQTVTASIVVDDGQKQVVFATDVNVGEEDIGAVVTLPMSYRFEDEVEYAVEFAVAGSATTIRAPLVLVRQPWPTFSDDDLELLRHSHNFPRSIRANVVCSSCSRAYILEATPLPDYQFAGGVTPFPENGQIECSDCGHFLHVKDLEGQVLASIKATLEATKGGD